MLHVYINSASLHKKCIKAPDGNTIKVMIAQNKFLKYPNLILKTGNNQKNSLWAVKLEDKQNHT